MIVIIKKRWFKLARSTVPFVMNEVRGGFHLWRNGMNNSNFVFSANSFVQKVPLNVMDSGSVKKELDGVLAKLPLKVPGNSVSDYLDDIVEAGNINATKMNKFKNAIQNNTFSVDELSEISKKMSDLGITKKYNEALIKIDFGKYLRRLIGDPPSTMINPGAHHILFKKGLGQTQQELVQEGQEILRRYGIDPIIGKENLVWAPNAVIGQHSLDALKNVVID